MTVGRGGDTSHGQEMTNIDAKREPGLNRQILALALPAIISNITVPLLGLCDTAVAGHLPEVAAIGAISVGSMMINVFCWLFGFLRMGTTGLVAQAYGAHRGHRGSSAAVERAYGADEA